MVWRTASRVGRVGQARVQRGLQRPRQYHLPVRRPAQQAVRPEVLAGVGVGRSPAELLLKIGGGGLLDEGIFGEP